MSSFHVACVNCGKVRACLLIESYIPDYDDGYELLTSVQVCRTCLRDPIAAMTLAAVLLGGHAVRRRHERTPKSQTRTTGPLRRSDKQRRPA